MTNGCHRPSVIWCKCADSLATTSLLLTNKKDAHGGGKSGRIGDSDENDSNIYAAYPLGKGEVECSIHSGSTRKVPEISAFLTLSKVPIGGFRQNNTQT